MRVCLDTSSLSFPPSGIRTYVDALIAELGRMPGEIDLSAVTPDSYGLPMTSRVPPRLSRFWWDAWAVGRAANRTGADILHVPQFSMPFRTTMPVVVTIHDLIPITMAAYRRSTAMRVYLEVMRRTVQEAAVIIVPSGHVASAASAMLGIERQRIRIIPMAAHGSLVPTTDRESLPAGLKQLGIDGPYVFNIAGFDVRKNLACLLEAFALFRQEAENPHKLVIAGAPHTGNHEIFPPVMPIVERLGLSDYVILPGLVSESTKVALYQYAAMYVTPSLEEGFGMTCLEAMSCGVPTIAADRASLPEVVGEGGLLVPPEPKSVAEAMLSIDQGMAFADELRVRGLVQAAKFSWSETAKQTVGAYEVATGSERYCSASQPR